VGCKIAVTRGTLYQKKIHRRAHFLQSLWLSFSATVRINAKWNGVVMERNRLVAAAREGDPLAIGLLLDTCRDYLLHLALREFPSRLQSKFGASDVVQDTLLEAHRDFAEFQGSSQEELLSWVRSILARNLSNLIRSYRTAKRNARKEVFTSEDEPLDNMLAMEPGPEAIAVIHENWKRLEEAVKRMPGEHEEVIRRRYFMGQTFETMAHELNRDISAVRRLWVVSIELLRDQLQENSA
jgi:RNA polymerase sigma-70 factor, ECF subfamily